MSKSPCDPPDEAVLYKLVLEGGTLKRNKNSVDRHGRRSDPEFHVHLAVVAEFKYACRSLLEAEGRSDEDEGSGPLCLDGESTPPVGHC